MMYFTDTIMNNCIRLDTDNKKPIYGSDQIYIDTPIRFATVTFELEDTDILRTAADTVCGRERIDDGCVNYQFFYGFNDLDGGRGDSSITVLAEDADGGTEQTFYIDLTEEEQGFMQEHLDKSCRNEIGEGIRYYLNEAVKKMAEYGC